MILKVYIVFNDATSTFTTHNKKMYNYLYYNLYKLQTHIKSIAKCNNALIDYGIPVFSIDVLAVVYCYMSKSINL